MTVEKLYPRSAWDSEAEPSMSILPTVGRTIHWQDADRDLQERTLFVTGLDYGPAQPVTSILARDYTEGDPVDVRIPAKSGYWHNPEDCPQKIAKS